MQLPFSNLTCYPDSGVLGALSMFDAMFPETPKSKVNKHLKLKQDKIPP